MGFTGVKVHFVPQMQEELHSAPDRAVVLARERSHQPQRFGLRLSIPREAHPPQQLQVAQRSSGALHVRLEQINGFAELRTLLRASLLDRPDHAAPMPHRGLAKTAMESIEERLASGKMARFDERREDGGVLERQAASLARRAHALAERQSNVKQILQQALGQRRDLPIRQTGVQYHQINVGIGRHVTAAKPAVRHKRHLAV
jgi:hypothetical protein